MVKSLWDVFFNSSFSSCQDRVRCVWALLCLTFQKTRRKGQHLVQLRATRRWGVFLSKSIVSQSCLRTLCLLMLQECRYAAPWEGPRPPARGWSPVGPLSLWCSRLWAHRWDWRRPTGAGWSSASRARTLAARAASLSLEPWTQTRSTDLVQSFKIQLNGPFFLN